MNDERSINLDAPLGAIHCRVGGRSARRDQPASVAHAFERLCESRWLALARDTCGALCAERATCGRCCSTGRWMRRSGRVNRRPALNADILALALAAGSDSPTTNYWPNASGGRSVPANSRWRAGACRLLHPRPARRLDARRRGAGQQRRFRRQSIDAAALRRAHVDAHATRIRRWGSSRGSAGTFAAHDVAWLESAGKQRLWIVPSLRLTILRVGDEPPASQGWDEAMIPDSIIRGMSGWQPSAVGEGVDPKKYAPH